ncbi:DNA-binding transcriptional regulator, HxlR family [Nakamurella panacisegetis]|uniref:DNA-binding transcriptional regulator, HxlR family n=1 Tax=Nakamurella panacisegetis TaxID=1090615 RepID=A0A1H0IGY9_9ACTN|nr:helix-turn-helix domain-containing protein [Nakamurella panacisegetis]SDO30311.1 DNA-binding transcriptional regulator, HxlR family [Nakamurella panacisegetis]
MSHPALRPPAPDDPAPDDPAPDVPSSLIADVFARGCSSRSVVETVAGKWGALVMLALAEEPRRFNALRRRVDGVSEKMLAQTLQALERDGMVNRDVQAEIPPRVEYSLTELGAPVAARLGALVSLVESETAAVLEARRRYDERQAR